MFQARPLFRRVHKTDLLIASQVFRTFPSKEGCAEHTDQSSVCSSIMRSDLIKVKLFKDFHNSGRSCNVLTATEGTEVRWKRKNVKEWCCRLQQNKLWLCVRFREWNWWKKLGSFLYRKRFSQKRSCCVCFYWQLRIINSNLEETHIFSRIYLEEMHKYSIINLEETHKWIISLKEMHIRNHWVCTSEEKPVTIVFRMVLKWGAGITFRWISFLPDHSSPPDDEHHAVSSGSPGFSFFFLYG